jgi:hypothetical protein
MHYNQTKRTGSYGTPIYSYHGLVMPALEAAARSLAVELRPVAVRTADEIDTAFAAMTDAGAEAILVLISSVSYTNTPCPSTTPAARARGKLCPFRSWFLGL